jgi:hypothetical protein
MSVIIGPRMWCNLCDGTRSTVAITSLGDTFYQCGTCDSRISCPACKSIYAKMHNCLKDGQ